MIASPTEVPIQHLIPLYVVVHNEGDGEGPASAKIVVDDEAALSAPSAYKGAYTPECDRLEPFDAVVGQARHLIECDGSAEWPAWEFGW
jgi:hypothetical protein